MHIKKLKLIFAKHKKDVPEFLKGTFIHEILRNGIFILISAWFFQGILYMRLGEKLFKILFDVVLTVLLSLFLPVWISVLIAHTLNFLFNGQFIAVLTHMGIFQTDSAGFIRYTEGLYARIQKVSCIEKALVYGSLTEGKFKDTSDLDIRIIPVHTKSCRLQCILWAIGERSRAFLAGFPLDMYVFTLSHSIRVMKTKSPPAVFKNEGKCISNYYYKFVLFQDFISQLKKVNTK